MAALLIFLLLPGQRQEPSHAPPSADSRVMQLKEAAALTEKHEDAAAEATLAPLLRLDRADPLALNLLGLVRLQQHREAEAKNLFEEAVRSGRPAAGPHINLARLAAADHPEEAMAELSEALKIAPGNRQAEEMVRSVAHDAALTYVQQGRRDAALNLLLKATQLTPSDPVLLYEYGLTALEAGKSKEAREFLSRALKYRTEFPEALYALARADLAENQPQEAESLMRRYLKAKPDDATGQYGLGYILIAEQKLDDAKAAFEKSLELNPAQTESIFQLGEIALEQDNVEAARERFLQVLEKDPSHSGALTEWAVIHYRAGRYHEAKELLERAIARTPDYQKARYFHALTLLKLGEKEEAEREFGVAQSLQKPHGSTPSRISEQ